MQNSRKKVGITGQNGFIGSYLYNTLCLRKDEFELIPFDRSAFAHPGQLAGWVKQCDAIVHLSALNRHPDPEVIFDTNVDLVKKLISAMEVSNVTPHVIFTSSTQEEMDNLYGNSKKEGRRLFSDWANKHNAKFSGMVVPNVFGPFGKPFYNSVVATFCHQLCHQQEPEINKDGFLKLIYVDELTKHIVDAIINETHRPEWDVPHTGEYYVSQILSQLNSFKDLYFDNGIIPSLPNQFSVNLFNTFRSFMNPGEQFPRHLKLNTDDRGTFVELIKLNAGGQVSFSTTHPGITRGNHFHTRKIERFAVIKGRARIQLRKFNTAEVFNFDLNGDEASYVDMPVWYTHNITNTGNEELYTIFWINEFFDPADSDTFFETV